MKKATKYEPSILGIGFYTNILNRAIEADLFNIVINN